MAPGTCILVTTYNDVDESMHYSYHGTAMYSVVGVERTRYSVVDATYFVIPRCSQSYTLRSPLTSLHSGSPRRTGLLRVSVKNVSESPRSYPLSVILTTSRSSTRSHRTRSASKTAPSRSRPSELPHTRRIAASPLVPSCAARRILSERHRLRPRALAGRAERASERHQSAGETARHCPDKAAGTRAVR